MYVNEEEEEEENEEEEEDITEKEENEAETISDDLYFTEIEESVQIYDKFIQGSSPSPSILNSKSFNYEELFSYLGQRITQNVYENIVSEDSVSMIEKISPIIIPVSTETIEKGIKKAKYSIPGNVMADSPIPYEGMTTEEYDKFRLWKILNPATAKFFMDFL